jgi:glycine/D-amino acid oxidase-like deaminating enzyme
MLRVLQSEDESQHARRRLAQPGYRPFLRDILPAPAGVTAPFGVLRQANTGYLLTRQLLACLQAFFSARDCYRRMELEYWRLTSDGAGWRWGDINARNIVFCEGYLAANNPWFGQLPFQCVKGEILTADMTADCPPWILNYRHWLLPLTAKRFKTGASFEPGVTDIETTPALKSRFFNAAQAVYPQAGPLTLLEHKAGVRPATLDKQPFVGAHPQQSNLFIFNGFGAKGGVAIPWHARHFADVFERRAAMAAHCDVQRHAAQLLA